LFCELNDDDEDFLWTATLSILFVYRVAVLRIERKKMYHQSIMWNDQNIVILKYL